MFSFVLISKTNLALEIESEYALFYAIFFIKFTTKKYEAGWLS